MEGGRGGAEYKYGRKNNHLKAVDMRKPL